MTRLMLFSTAIASSAERFLCPVMQKTRDREEEGASGQVYWVLTDIG